MKVMTYLSCLAKMRSWRILLLVSLPDCKKEVNSDFFPFGGGGGRGGGWFFGWLAGLVWFPLYLHLHLTSVCSLLHMQGCCCSSGSHDFNRKG